MFAASKSGKAAAAAAATDPYFPYVPLLLNTTSTNGQQNNTFLDSSTNNFTITRNGTPTQGSFTPYQPSGYWSGYFGATSNYLSTPDATAFNLSGGSWTIECWIYPNGTYTDFNNIVLKRGASTAWQLYLNQTTGYLSFFNLTSAYNSTSTPIANAWNHIAAVYDGTNINLYLNGSRVLQSATGNTDFSAPIYVGAYATQYQYLGYISNVRIVKGTAIYSGATYTVPTTPLTAITNTSLLTLQSNRFIDNSTNAFAITVNGTPKVQAFQPFSPAASYSAATYGGSGYFSGSASDYLSVGSAATDYLGSGDFTLEAWVYKTTTATGTVAGKWNGTGFGWVLYTPSNAFAWIVAGGSSGMTGTIPIPLFAWTHVVISRSGSNWALFVNGVRDKTASTSTAPFNNTTQVLQIGIFESASGPFPGLISNLRIVKGTAVYDPTLTTLTVPTAPVTAITNTFLLTNFTNAGIYDAAWQNNALTVGDAQTSISQYKWSPTSIRFDGTGDWLTMPNAPAFQISGNYTIEAWVYATSINAFQNILSQYVNSTNAFACGYNSTSGWYFNYRNNAAEVTNYRAGTSPLNAWTYVAFVKSGTTMTIYINGSALSSTFTVPDLPLFNSTLYVGLWAGASDSPWTGYIQDLRITKGVARTITTPTAAFPTR